MKEIRISLKTHIVPKKNALRAGVRNDGTTYQYTPTKSETSQLNVRADIEEAVRKQGWRCTKKPVKVVACFKKTGADTIGIMETVLDCMEDFVYDNDRQVYDQRSFWDTEGILAEGETGRVLISEIEEKVK